MGYLEVAHHEHETLLGEKGSTVRRFTIDSSRIRNCTILDTHQVCESHVSP